MVVCDMQTTQTIEMTVSFAKKVSKLAVLSPPTRLITSSSVWVGPLVVKELKHIVEASEITK